MEYIEVSAKTVDDAILEAAIKFGTTREKIAYEVLSQGSAGFLGIGSKKAVIKAHVQTEEELEASKKAEKEVEKIMEKVNEKAAEKQAVSEPKKEPEKEVKPEPKKEPAKEEKPEDPVNTEKDEKPEKKTEKKLIEIDTAPVEEFLNQVFAAMEMKVQITVDAHPQDREIIVDLQGEDMGVLIGKRGQTLDSLQYLTSLVVNKGNSPYISILLDTENYRQRRKETLESLAYNLAKKVKQTKRNVVLEPMNPYDRRIIHSSLQNDRYVTTYSEGEEPYRNVVITLK